MHPRHWKHGGEKRIAFGGGVSLEPTTENMVEICLIVEGAVLTGAALSVFDSSQGRNNDGRDYRKYGIGRIVGNTSASEETKKTLPQYQDGSSILLGRLSKATRKHVHTPHPLILPTFSMNRHGMWKDDAHQAACRTAELSHI